MAFGVGMDQDFDAGKFLLQSRLYFVHDPMRFRYGHGGIYPDMKLHEALRAARSGAHVMNAF